VGVAIGIINLYAAVTCQGSTCSLSLYGLAICAMPSVLIAFVLYLFFSGANMDTIFIVRVAVMIFCAVYACFIVICVYTNTVTETWYTTSIVVAGNSANLRTSSENFGYVNCREWYVRPM